MMKTMGRMTTMMLGRLAALLALALAFALAVSFDAAAGQSAAVDRTEATSRADLMAEHGRQLAKFRGDFEGGSRYLRSAAELRGADAVAVKELIEAAHMSYYGGQHVVSMNTLARAGKLALDVGDATMAAGAYLDAAWVAHRTGQIEAAREFLLTGESLARSAAVAPEDRVALLARIGEPPR